MAEMGEIDHRPFNKEDLGNQQVGRVMMTMKDQGKEDRTRDPQEGVGGRMMMMTRRMNLPPAMREDFPEPEGKPSGKPPNNGHNLLRNTYTPNTRLLGFGLLQRLL